MSLKIDVRKIVKDHKKTLVDQFTDKPSFSDYFSFLWGPILLAATLVYFNALITDSMISTLISALAIFVGLLLNVVVLLFDIVRKYDSRNSKVDVVREVLANIMFTILLSVACILATLTTLIKYNYIITSITNFISYFLLSMFLTTLLMVIKRMYALFENEVNEAVNPKQ